MNGLLAAPSAVLESLSKKSHKIAALLDEIVHPSVGDPIEKGLDPHYLGFFECFNRQMYYEAHDVLEELWLGTRGGKHLFYKGLIQLAGAFVHLKKSKLDPAARLFRLASKNLEPYAPMTDSLDVDSLLVRIRNWRSPLEDSPCMQNPYQAEEPPQIFLMRSKP